MSQSAQSEAEVLNQDLTVRYSNVMRAIGRVALVVDAITALKSTHS